MAVSFGMLGILLMLDVCFIVNFFFIRALRQWTDQNQKQKRKLEASRGSTKKKKKDCQREKGQACTANSNHHEANPSSSSAGDGFIFASRERDIAFAWCLGTVRLEPLRVKKFHGWKRLPGRAGLWTTSFFILLGSILLSSKLLVNDMGVSSGSLDSDLCVFEDFEEGLQELRSKLQDMTHLAEAQQQHRLMVAFSEALLNDTALYGVPPHDCPKRGRISGLKDQWDQPGPFFPGYCSEALEAAIEAAKNRECTEKICDCPTLPDSAVFQVAGLANKKYCGEVCIDVPFACPQHSADDAFEALTDYRFRQFEAAEKRRLRQQKQYKFPTSATEIIQSSATDIVDKIMRQVEIASYGYIAYSCTALFFPTPLNLFRAPHWVALKQFFFGAQKHYFIIFVLSFWWGAEYFRKLWYSPDIRLYLNNLRVGDPCFLDMEYLMERQSILNEYCEALVPLEPQWNSSLLTSIDVLVEVEHFTNDCDCPFPNEHLGQWKDSLVGTNVTEFGFSPVNTMCASKKDMVFGDECSMFVPSKDDIVFHGNASICSNKTAARRLILEAPMPEQGDKDWYDLWIASAFLATLLVKVAVANFGVSLMELADPFSVCAGEYLGLPVSSSTLNENRDQLWSAVLKSKRRSLFVASLSRTVCWGFAMHACLFNMFAAVYDGSGATRTSAELAIEQRDKNVLAGCLGFAITVALTGIYVIRKIHERIQDMQITKPSSELEATDEEEFDDGEIMMVHQDDSGSLGDDDGKSRSEAVRDETATFSEGHDASLLSSVLKIDSMVEMDFDQSSNEEIRAKRSSRSKVHTLLLEQRHF